MKDNEGQDSVNRIKAVKNRDNFKLKKVNKIDNFRIKFVNFLITDYCIICIYCIISFTSQLE